MKSSKVLALLALFLAVAIISAEGSYTAVVVATSGASLHEGPGKDTKILLVIPADSLVSVYEEISEEDTGEGAADNWLHVGWKEEDGYVFGDLLKPAEELLIKTLGNRASRDGNKLTLLLENGKSVSFDNFSSELEYREDKVFTLEAYLPERKLYLIYHGYYEGGVTIMVNSVDGRKTELDTKPIFSPDGKRFVTENYDLSPGYPDNRLSIYDFSDGIGKLEWSHEPDEWAPCAAEWTSNTSIKFTKYAPDTSDDQDENAPPPEMPTATVVYDDQAKAWQLSE